MITETTIDSAVLESQQQLAETIAKMADGILRTHGIILPRGARKEFEGKTLEFIGGNQDVTAQIRQQLVKAMTRPPAA